MCLAIPGRVLSIDGNRGVIEVGNIKREVLLHLIPDVSLGEYVLIHAGCAIEKVDEKESQITLDLIKELARYEISR